MLELSKLTVVYVLTRINGSSEQHTYTGLPGWLIGDRVSIHTEIVNIAGAERLRYIVSHMGTPLGLDLHFITDPDKAVALAKDLAWGSENGDLQGGFFMEILTGTRFFWLDYQGQSWANAAMRGEHRAERLWEEKMLALYGPDVFS